MSIRLALWGAHWCFLFAVAAFAWWRLRSVVTALVAAFAGGFIVYGALMMPLSYLLLEKAKWSLLPQFQPMRALLFVTLFAILGAALHGIRAALRGAAWASIPWFSAAFGIGAQLDLQRLPWASIGGTAMRARLLVFVGLAAVAFVSVRFYKPALIVALALPFYLIPEVAKIRNYRELDHPEIHALADWALAHTGKDAVFQFAEAGQALYPGLFRVYARRAVYVDWKVGGQVNLLDGFAAEWWQRWQAAGAPGTLDPERWAALGIDYAVVQPQHALPGRAPEYRNARYLVYRVR